MTRIDNVVELDARVFIGTPFLLSDLDQRSGRATRAFAT
jgi:hypothetical protein